MVHSTVILVIFTIIITTDNRREYETELQTKGKKKQHKNRRIEQ